MVLDTVEDIKNGVRGLFTLAALMMLLMVILFVVWLWLSLKYSEKVGSFVIGLKNRLLGERKSDE